MFTVKITEHKTKTTGGCEWLRLSDSGNPQGGGSIYGYGPPVEKEEEYSLDVYEQTLETLDLRGIILAINKGGA